MIIIGIDPGSRKTGFAVIEIQGRKIKYIDSGVFAFDGVNEFIDRLGLIYNCSAELIKTYNPVEVALESLIYVKSVTSLAKLAQARGAMVAAFKQNSELKIAEYGPNLVKSTITGHGHASKDAVDKALGMIMGKKIDFKTHDESDALAIAICHALLRDKQIVDGKKNIKKGKNTLKSVFKNMR